MSWFIDLTPLPIRSGSGQSKKNRNSTQKAVYQYNILLLKKRKTIFRITEKEMSEIGIDLNYINQFTKKINAVVIIPGIGISTNGELKK